MRGDGLTSVDESGAAWPTVKDAFGHAGRLGRRPVKVPPGWRLNWADEEKRKKKKKKVKKKKKEIKEK